jgi:hypothetical protein
MKNHLLLLVFVLLFASCTKKVEISVFNNSDIDRTNETVELCLCELEEFDATQIVVLDTVGKQVPYQLIYKGTDKPQSLIFQVSLAAGKEAVFTIKQGKPESYPAKTYARFVPERKDDIAWENDRIAFRMYGPALAPEHPSNGVDVWYKRTTDLIINKWYANELSKKSSYHDDNGEGLDCYKVAYTLGAGGIAPYSKDSLWLSRYFDRYQVLDNGPIRSSFVLFYDSIPYCNHVLKAEMMVSLDAGSNLSEVRIKYTGDTTNIQLAAGIYLHDSIQNKSVNAAQGCIGYAENLISQGQVPTPSGRGYTGVVFPVKLSETKQLSGHILGICKYRIGDEFRYYFGAGWNKHGFASDQDWFSYLNTRHAALMQPLKVKILK